MRILFSVTRADSFGGSSTHVRDLCVRLRSQGHEVEVLIGGEGQVTERLREAGVPVVPLRHLIREVHPLRDLLGLWEYVREIRRFRPDIVSCHTSKAGFLGRIAGDLCGVPTIYLPHCWSFVDGFPRAWLFRWAEKFGALWGSGIIAVSEDERQQGLEKAVVGGSGIQTIVNGMPEVAGHFSARPEVHPPSMVMIGRFEGQKDQPTLIAALGRLKHLPWTLRLIGNGPLEDEARAQAAELALTGRVEFMGYRRDIPEQLAAAQIYLLISHWEGFARSIIEAMRAGLPVIASDVGGAREAVFTGYTGALVPRNDVDKLTAALEPLLAQPSLRSKLGMASRRWYENNLTFEHMFARYFALYGRMVRTSII